MNITPWYEEAMRMYSTEHFLDFEEYTKNLPSRLETTPYHSGPHSIRNFEMAFKLSGNPKRVLEIGFCLGHSASIWLHIGADHVTSIDNSMRAETAEAATIMARAWGSKRFQFISGSTEFLNPPKGEKFDLAFIDGDHGIEAVDRDTKFCLDLGIPYILFDDWFTHWSEGVQPAVEKYKLVPIAILGSMALCVPEKNLT